MYEIATLKTKKLPELQEIAKKIGVKRIAGLKKLDLIYQIVDFIASKPDDEPAKAAPAKPEKAKEEATEKKAPLKVFPVQKSKPKPQHDKKQGTQKHPNNNKQQNKNNPPQGAAKNNGNNPTGNGHPNNRTNPNQGKNNNRNESNHNKDNRSRYREPDFEFDGIVQTEGVLEIMPEGYGFLRSSDYNYLSSPDDVYASQSQIRLFGLKTGDTILGSVRPPKEGEKYFPLIKVDKINGLDPKVVRDRVAFEHLTPLFPQEKFNLADKSSTISTRIMDLFSPIG
jgi:transcription termination factor Rho